MKEKIKEFFSDTWNIVLTIFQCIGVLAFIFMSLSIIFTIIFLLFEGVFFILLSIKIWQRKRKILEQQDIYDQLPYTHDQLEYIHKTNANAIKNIKLMSVLVMSLGIVLIFCIFSVIF